MKAPPWRANYQSMVRRYMRQFQDWGKVDPNMRHKPFRDHPMITPRMCDMDESLRREWAERISSVDAQIAINKHNEALGRAKQRAGEAA